MAKPHRMAAVTVGCGLGFLEAAILGTHWAPMLVILVVALGTAFTAWARLARIARALKGRAS